MSGMTRWRALQPLVDEQAAMEPALGERDDVIPSRRACRLEMPQWSPLLVSGMTSNQTMRLRYHATAAMEPALGERDDGSRKTSRLTCGDMAACEQRRIYYTVSLPDGLIKVHARPLNWARALPGTRVTTMALAIRR